MQATCIFSTDTQGCYLRSLSRFIVRCLACCSMSFGTCSRAFAEPLILDFVPSLHCFLRVRMAVFRTVRAKWMLARQATLRIMPVPIIPKVTFNGFIYLALFALLTVLAVPRPSRLLLFRERPLLLGSLVSA